MKVSEIFSGISVDISNGDIEVTALVCDSKSVEKNSMFFCLKGENYNGENFAKEAQSKGAVCIVSEKKLDVETMNVVVDDVRLALSCCSANFYSNPQKKMTMIGVVGTNGKTSTTKILQSILNKAQKPCAVIGTIGINFNGVDYENQLTTPDPIDLFASLKKLYDDGAQAVAMEVSAHAIALKKIAAIRFDYLIFTNCTQDHLDYFKSFENYKSVKKSIFDKKYAQNMIVNTDDSLGAEIVNGETGAMGYGILNPAEVFAINCRQDVCGVSFIVNAFDEIYFIKSQLVGSFNIYNILAALTTAKLIGIDIETIASAISELAPISGRMEKVATLSGGNVFIDYAHTPDGLEKALISLRKVTDGNLYVVFGCGGNRDSTKRQIMGKIAGDLADFVIVTSDNPRFEDSYKIISQIETGLRESSLDYICIENRKKAIIYGLKLLGAGDNLLIAGKGAENYQEVMGVYHEFNDKGVVLEYIDG